MTSYQNLEDGVFYLFNNHKNDTIYVPENIKSALGINSTRIIDVNSSIRTNPQSKTDVLITFSDQQKLKISVKKENAHYFGNWYTHQRICEEFGEDALYDLISATTAWANDWIYNSNSSLFVGVSLCFGYRSGNTGIDILEILNIEDIKSIVQGYDLNADTSANCLYTSNYIPTSVEDFFDNTVMFTNPVINTFCQNLKIIFRPINPETEGSNRGKQIFTKYSPYQKENNMTIFNSVKQLRENGEFICLGDNNDYRLNHNQWINELRTKFNIQIPVKR